VKDLVGQAVEANRFNVKIADFDPIADKFMAIKLYGRGSIDAKQLESTIEWTKNNQKVHFLDWCHAFKVNVCPKPMAKTEGENFGTSGNSVVVMGNNVAMSRKFSGNNSTYDMMYSQRAYVHHYVNYGMEEGEFSHSREDMGFLEKDYLDLTSEQHGNENDEFDDDDTF